MRIRLVSLAVGALLLTPLTAQAHIENPAGDSSGPAPQFVPPPEARENIPCMNILPSDCHLHLF